MKRLLRKITELLSLFLVGGTIYYSLEVFWKTVISHGTLHWTMFLLGGFCFLLIGAINEHLPWEMGLWKQATIGAVTVTVLEFIFGYILNIRMGLGIWDYSNTPMNIMGQVCVPFMLAWFVLSIVAIILDDFLRWKLFNEEKPHYHWRDHANCEI